MTPETLHLVECLEFNKACEVVIYLVSSRFQEADAEERLTQCWLCVEEAEFQKNETKLLQMLIDLEQKGASKEDIICGLQHFETMLSAHAKSFEKLAKLAETL